MYHVFANINSNLLCSWQIARETNAWTVASAKGIGPSAAVLKQIRTWRFMTCIRGRVECTVWLRFFGWINSVQFDERILKNSAIIWLNREHNRYHMFSLVCTLLRRGSSVLHLTCRMLRGHMQFQPDLHLYRSISRRCSFGTFASSALITFWEGRHQLPMCQEPPPKRRRASRLSADMPPPMPVKQESKANSDNWSQKLFLDENHQPFLEVSNYIIKHM